MSARGASEIYFADDGSFIARDPTTGRYTLYTRTGTQLMSVDPSGNLYLTGAPKSLNGLATAGQGLPLIVSAPAVAADKSTAQTNFINYTPAAAAGVYRLTCLVNVTAWTTPASFTVVVTYTDSKGTAQTETVGLIESDGTPAAAVDTVDRYYGIPMLIAIDNSATAITLSTSGTFSGSPVYQLAAVLERVI
jgi:hypothetical protein